MILCESLATPFHITNRISIPTGRFFIKPQRSVILPCVDHRLRFPGDVFQQFFPQIIPFFAVGLHFLDVEVERHPEQNLEIVLAPPEVLDCVLQIVRDGDMYLPYEPGSKPTHPTPLYEHARFTVPTTNRGSSTDAGSTSSKMESTRSTSYSEDDMGHPYLPRPGENRSSRYAVTCL